MTHFDQPRRNPLAGRTRLIATLSASALVLVCALQMQVADSHACGPASGEKAAGGAPQPATVRIGTYDSRAIAVAYARSAQFAQKMKDLQRQHAEAVKAADTKRAGELEAQGQSMQVRMHLQGFSTAPVADVLDTVRDKLPEIAQQKNVMAIACSADYHDAPIELVDVTDELVRLFNPDAHTLKIVNDVRNQKPLAIEEAAKSPAK